MSLRVRDLRALLLRSGASRACALGLTRGFGYGSRLGIDAACARISQRGRCRESDTSMQTRVVRAGAAGLFLWSAAAWADPAPEPVASESEMQEVHVTGSRVARDANRMPTPVTAIGQDQIR